MISFVNPFPNPSVIHESSIIDHENNLNTESGETMKAAGLKAIDTVVESTAVLVKSKDSKSPLVDLITSRIHGVISKKDLPIIIVYSSLYPKLSPVSVSLTF